MENQFTIENSEIAAATVTNSLTALTGMLSGGGNPYGYGQQISQNTTMYQNLRWYLISNDRSLLSQMYAEIGIVQTLIDQPVEDAFRSGFEIKSGQLSGEEIEDLEAFYESSQLIDATIQALKWARLFGGAAVLLITDQRADKLLDTSKLNDKATFEFRAVDMWELQNDALPNPTAAVAHDAEYYFYYGVKVHASRLFILKGKEAPSFVRPRLRGWGMSELERLVRSINSYLKNQDVVFEQLDESKIDVYKIKGFTSALLSRNGAESVASRIQSANLIKNYQNAIAMDIDDDYQQKQMSFSGLAEILTQIRQGIAADLRMPMTKLFGISAAGFSSGEEDTENYNSMVEREIRVKTKGAITELMKIACQIKFGFIPDDLQIKFKPLRVLSAKDEQEIKTATFSRVVTAHQMGLMTGKEAKESINKDSLLPTEVDASSDALPPSNFDAGG